MLQRNLVDVYSNYKKIVLKKSITISQKNYKMDIFG